MPVAPDEDEVHCRHCKKSVSKTDCAKQGSRKAPSYCCKLCRNAELQLWRTANQQGEQATLL